MKQIEIEWFECEVELPEEPGWYLTTDRWGDVDFNSFAGGKWNAHYQTDGILFDKYASPPEWFVAWAYPPKGYKA